jgi:hypothetical protein
MTSFPIRNLTTFKRSKYDCYVLIQRQTGSLLKPSSYSQSEFFRLFADISAIKASPAGRSRVSTSTDTLLHIMAPIEVDLNDYRAWDDNALVNSWEGALAEYKVIPPT